MRSNSTACRSCAPNVHRFRSRSSRSLTAIDARQLFLPRQLLFRDRARVRLERRLARLVRAPQALDVSLVIVRRNQFVLAARKKR